MMAWRRSSTVALGSAGGQDTKGSLPGSQSQGLSQGKLLGAAPPELPDMGGVGSRAIHTQGKKPHGSEYSLVILMPSSGFLLKALKN